MSLLKINSYKLTIFVSLVLIFHIGRNISSVYFIFLGLAHFFNIIFLIQNKKSYNFNKLTFVILLFFLYSFFIFLNTLTSYDLSSSIYGLIRLLFVLPFYPLFVDALNNSKRIIQFYNFLAIYILLSLFFIPFQFIYGTISYFPDPGERASLIRYSTNLGSLTVTGIACVLSLTILSTTIKNKFLNYIFVFINFSLGLATLQKAFFGGIIFLLFLRRKFLKHMFNFKNFAFLVISLLAAVFIINLMRENISEIDLIFKYVESQLTINNSSDYQTGDVSISESVSSRLTGGLVQQSLNWLYEHKGWFAFIIGGDFGMLGPALLPDGYSNYFTSHNQFVDFILIGGIIYLFIFLLIIKNVIKIFLNNKSVSASSEISKNIFLIIILLSFFGGGITFQPIIGLFLWSSIAIANNIKYGKEYI